MTKYSFVLPAYKACYFKEALESILNQTYSDFELIIVNDASPEDLDSIVSEFDDSRITYYTNETNIGGKDLVEQWNKSLTYAKGEYVILASDDDVYSLDYLEKMNALVDKYPEVRVFRPRIQIIGSSSNIVHQFNGLSERINQVEYLYHWMRGGIGSGIGYFIFHRETLINQGGFFNLPLAWGSDDVTVINLTKSGLAFSPDILYSFRKSGINITTKINDTRTLSLKLQSYKKFERWLEELVNTLGSELDETNEYYDYIKQNYKKRFMVALTLDLLKSSTASAIINNARNYYQLKCINFFKGTFWLLRELFKKAF